MTLKHQPRPRGGSSALARAFLCSSYARALSRLYQLEKVGIPCTVDLRKYAKDKTGIANLTGSYNLNLQLRSGAAFADTLADTSRRMKKQKGTQNDLAGPMLLVSKYEKSSLEQFLKLYGGMDTSPSADYTNLGILDAQRLIFDGMAVKNAVVYSGLSKAPYFQLAVSTYQGEATVASLVQCSEAEKANAERILDAVVEELAAFAGPMAASRA